jgi:CheY-like chemotaxis protein
MGTTDSIDNILSEYDEGTKHALVCEERPDVRNTISAALKGLKYMADEVSTAEETIEKMKFNQYDVIILSETFAGSTPDDNEALKHLQVMPMNTRRHIFVALIGQNLKTNDNATAFTKSMNVVVNSNDLGNLAPILKKSIADNDHFYKVFKESLVKMGKR